MFLSKDDLKLTYGVDLQISEAFINRKVPSENLYWQNRLIYIPSAPGYFFMPIFSDLLLRCGVEREYLIGEEYFIISELILQSAALFEHKKIKWNQQVEKIFEDVAPYVKRKKLFSELEKYLSQPVLRKIEDSLLGTQFPSLNRADTYLLLLACIPSKNFDEKKAIAGWYALMTYFLIMDDLSDIKEDLTTNEENVLIDAGLDDCGLKLISEMIDHSHDILLAINPVMANRIDHKRKVMDLRKILQSITS